MGEALFRKVQRIILLARLPIILAVTMGLTAIGYFLALGLRFDFDTSLYLGLNRFWLPLSFLLFFRCGAYIYWGLNRGYWRYATTHDLLNILKAHLVSTFLFTAAVGFFRLPGFPRSVIFIEFTLSILFSGGSRFFVRLLCEHFLSQVERGGALISREVIVLGAGDSGHLLVKNLRTYSRLPYIPVAILDDGERVQGGYVQGVPVIGTLADLRGSLERYPHVSAVIVAIPTLSDSRFTEIEELCKHLGVALKRLQSFEDIACHDADLFQPSLTIESALEKEIDIQHEDEIREALRGKRVLVTGAGGSIGSEIVRQLLTFSPKTIVLLDHSEYNTFRIGRELSAKESTTQHHLVLANICNEDRLLKIFHEHKPQVVFHAAAYKHVPLMEDNPYEAFNNNIVGTRNILRVCDLCDVEKFVQISTDKAVDPSSLMGCSKRITEMLIQEYSHAAPLSSSSNRMHTSIVRFGNVINSAGSVVPTFKEQIQSGGPITVTHPDMERFFMSIREAVRVTVSESLSGECTRIRSLCQPKRAT